MSINTDSVINQLFSGGAALAGLILVFLGGVIASFDSYDTAQKNAVRGKYRWRARLAVSGFLAALVAAGCAFVANWFLTRCLIAVSSTALAIACVLVLAMAFAAVKEI